HRSTCLSSPFAFVHELQFSTLSPRHHYRYIVCIYYMAAKIKQLFIYSKSPVSQFRKKYERNISTFIPSYDPVIPENIERYLQKNLELIKHFKTIDDQKRHFGNWSGLLVPYFHQSSMFLVAPQYHLATCQISKNMATIRFSIFCFLAN
ncbi:hypothetical protein GCK32_013795, partial [Trichostrongylus colubriformis]